MTPVTARSPIATSGPALLRHLRVVHRMMFASMLALPLVAWMMRQNRVVSPPAMIHTVMGLAGAAALLAIALHLGMVTPALRQLRREGDRPDLLIRLRKGHIYALTASESVAMFAVELYLHGASLPPCGIVWAAGLLLGIVFWPRAWAVPTR